MLRTGELPNLGPSKYGPARFSVPRFEALIRALRELSEELLFDEDSPASRQDAFRFTPVVPLLLERIFNKELRETMRSKRRFAMKRNSISSSEVIPFKKFIWNTGPPGQNKASRDWNEETISNFVCFLSFIQTPRKRI